MAVLYCGNTMWPCWAFFRDMRYSQCVSCTAASYITYRMCVKVFKIIYIYIYIYIVLRKYVMV